MVPSTTEESVKEVNKSKVNSLLTTIHFDRSIYHFLGLSLKQKISFYVYWSNIPIFSEFSFLLNAILNDRTAWGRLGGRKTPKLSFKKRESFKSVFWSEIIVVHDVVFHPSYLLQSKDRVGVICRDSSYIQLQEAFTA